MVEAYFKQMQPDIAKYRERLDRENVVIDKTNMLFLNLILNILDYLATEDAEKLDIECEYNILTMKKEFESVIYGDVINEKTRLTLLTFFLRIAKEMDVKYKKIENQYLQELYTIMTSKGYKYPSYVGDQKEFALDKMPENIKRMELLR